MFGPVGSLVVGFVPYLLGKGIYETRFHEMILLRRRPALFMLILVVTTK